MLEAKRFAEQFGCILLYKGARTVVASPDGRVWINTTGNPGMAKGGSGDVLTGIISSLIAGGAEPAQAAACGAYLHGAAGDACAEKLGEYGMLAGDIIDELPLMIKKLQMR